MSCTTIVLIAIGILGALGGLGILIAYIGLAGQCTAHDEEQDIEGGQDNG